MAEYQGLRFHQEIRKIRTKLGHQMEREFYQSVARNCVLIATRNWVKDFEFNFPFHVLKLSMFSQDEGQL